MAKPPIRRELSLPRQLPPIGPMNSLLGATLLADTDDEVIGKTLNNTYAVERIIGEGAMGRVYQARHTRIAQKHVAVKMMRPEYARNADVLARFQREVETAASISHPNVVAVFDVDRTQHGIPYLVSEYLEGLDLGRHLKQQKKLGLATSVHIACQLCEGLRGAHQCGVIHRDLKPHNVFLVGDFVAGVPEFPFVKILDFGLSKFMDAPPGQMITEAGIVMGTPSFMPPEQAQGLGPKVDLRADVYGVGALLYTCLTGRLPFDEETPQATVLAVIGTEPPRPRELDPTIPEPVELVILRAMAKDPSLRYQDMTELLKALRPLAAGQEVRREIGSPRTVERLTRVHAAMLASIATLALAAVAIPAGLRWQTKRTGVERSGTVTLSGAAASLMLANQARSATVASSSPSASPQAPSPPESAASNAPSASPQASTHPESAAPPIAPAPSKRDALLAPAPTPELASESELLAARAAGKAGWLALAEQYPTDARVLRALVFAHASLAAELGDAMLVAQRLFQVAPDEAKGRDLQYIVQRAAETRGSTAELAWKMLAGEMGTYGPDVLYSITLARPKLAERARQLLHDGEVRQRISPALAIAQDLRTAPTCAQRLPLLERAIEVGDKRALAVLAGLSTRTKRGCGRNKRSSCPPTCPEEAARFRDAVTRLALRLSGEHK